MSHKYEVEGLRKRALRHLSSGYSISLAQNLSAKLNQSWPHCGNYIPIIALARQVSADWIIPASLYRLCAELQEEEIFRGVLWDGSVVRLSELDQIHAFRALNFLRGDATAQILAFLWSPSEIDGCTNGPKCALARFQGRRKAEWWRHSKGASLMPMEIWESADFEKHLKPVCRVCLAGMKSAHRRARNTLWDRLPTLCGLPHWEALEEAKNKALQ
jgi:hypothetical protein